MDDVVFATAEFAPVARVGGLAGAAAGLVKALRSAGRDVEVVLPDYSGLTLREEAIEVLDVPTWVGPATARRGVLGRAGPITLVNVPGMRQSHPYLLPDGTGRPDNDRRFYAFAAAVAAITDSRQADLLHLNDWHTAGALAHLRRPIPSVLTIHTLAYQGQSNRGWLDAFGEHRDAFDFGGACNPLAGGIRMADCVITVSPHHAAESLTPEGGFGLHELLSAKGEAFVGILNGIDVDEWDPVRDTHLAAPYDATDLSGKVANRSAVRDELGLPDDDEPLIAMVTRLVEQKGVDLILPAVPHLPKLPAQLVVLGSGDLHLADALRAVSSTYPRRVGFRDGYDHKLAHRLIAGADLFLMPSRFEPCGLAQMQAMRYGTLPIVTDVGGLHDTVVDIDSAATRGTGVVATTLDSLGVLDALHRAVRAHRQPARRSAMRRRAMAIDWSWAASAQRHLELYERLVSGGPGSV